MCKRLECAEGACGAFPDGCGGTYPQKIVESPDSELRGVELIVRGGSVNIANTVMWGEIYAHSAAELTLSASALHVRDGSQGMGTRGLRSAEQN